MGFLGQKGEPGLLEKTQGEVSTTAVPTLHSSQGPSLEAEESFLSTGAGGRAMSTKPALVLPVEAIIIPFHVLRATKAAALELGLGSNPDPHPCSLHT